MIEHIRRLINRVRAWLASESPQQDDPEDRVW